MPLGRFARILLSYMYICIYIPSTILLSIEAIDNGRDDSDFCLLSYNNNYNITFILVFLVY